MTKCGSQKAKFNDQADLAWLMICLDTWRQQFVTPQEVECIAVNQHSWRVRPLHSISHLDQGCIAAKEAFSNGQVFHAWVRVGVNVGGLWGCEDKDWDRFTVQVGLRDINNDYEHLNKWGIHTPIEASLCMCWSVSEEFSVLLEQLPVVWKFIDTFPFMGWFVQKMTSSRSKKRRRAGTHTVVPSS